MNSSLLSVPSVDLAISTHGRVLLVDDEIALIEVEARRLRAAGFEVEALSSASAALAAFRLCAFDVIVSDISMPDMDGIQFLREVRVLDADVPVLLRTGGPSIQTAAHAVELGALKYMLKPVAFDDLVPELRRATQLNRLGQAKRRALSELGTLAGEGSDRLALTASFDRMLEGLWIAFQPIIRADRSLYGYEALLRSREPALPHPGAVLDAAERLGRLEELGRVIRERTLAAVPEDASWSLFLNLHPRDLLDPQLVEGLRLRPTLLPRVVLEVTERASLDDVPGARACIAALRHLGCRIAIDDLGAGYAGLASFVQLTPDIVKLDMSLIRGADQSEVKQRLIRSLSEVCQDLGLLVVAEGIETAAERDTMLELGCHLLQGYRFGRPEKPFVAPVW